VPLVAVVPYPGAASRTAEVDPRGTRGSRRWSSIRRCARQDRMSTGGTDVEAVVATLRLDLATLVRLARLDVLEFPLRRVVDQHGPKWSEECGSRRLGSHASDCPRPRDANPLAATHHERQSTRARFTPCVLTARVGEREPHRLRKRVHGHKKGRAVGQRNPPDLAQETGVRGWLSRAAGAASSGVSATHTPVHSRRVL
jgi:hypothetical protein